MTREFYIVLSPLLTDSQIQVILDKLTHLVATSDWGEVTINKDWKIRRSGVVFHGRTQNELTIFMDDNLEEDEISQTDISMDIPVLCMYAGELQAQILFNYE